MEEAHSVSPAATIPQSSLASRSMSMEAFVRCKDYSYPRMLDKDPEEKAPNTEMREVKVSSLEATEKSLF